MKYHKENLHCVYLFKEAQKCYAKLTSSYEKTQNWLMTSGLFVSDINDKNCGGVHSFYDEKENQYRSIFEKQLLQLRNNILTISKINFS